MIEEVDEEGVPCPPPPEFEGAELWGQRHAEQPHHGHAHLRLRLHLRRRDDERRPVADDRHRRRRPVHHQLEPDRPVADGELVALVADSLATYKHLRHLVVVDSIPRLPSGKVLRRTLRDTLTLTPEPETRERND